MELGKRKSEKDLTSVSTPVKRQILTNGSYVLIVLTALSYLGSYNQVCEILSHFVFFYLILSAIALGFACSLRLKTVSAVGALSLCLNIARIAPEYAPISHTPPPGAESIRILAFNCEGKKN